MSERDPEHSSAELTEFTESTESTEITEITEGTEQDPFNSVFSVSSVAKNKPEGITMWSLQGIGRTGPGPATRTATNDRAGTLVR